MHLPTAVGLAVDCLAGSVLEMTAEAADWDCTPGFADTAGTQAGRTVKPCCVGRGSRGLN